MEFWNTEDTYVANKHVIFFTLNFFFYLKLFQSGFAQLNEFVLAVCGVCHTSYAQPMCKVVFLSAVCDRPSHMCGVSTGQEKSVSREFVNIGKRSGIFVKLDFSWENVKIIGKNQIM